MLETEFYDCPYCGERVETCVDLSGGDQVYTEDCQVCCRPIVFVLQVHDDEWMLDVRREDDA
ncbi:CPXCG motif-containing cysteine-rich protein [Pseudomonas fulva]|uniref:CPXCG motif-containing cysteine-rich protein n=1 Tax=Pseudomonas TaxID=286 RepID=UPI000D872871|nr:MULTISPECIES: CPXCG motif-containing cysteine-rich protein [Pseudomonas]MDH0619649.1 CPXCG motif-containing cysteine-rich protein [Pseudomonas fulva]MDH1308306.1 CPXCG motif-containing cysteine-rich protein [Pseudomonas fulva]PYB93049.1 CPXCG motif-containing cysteine-rich protein [Pseudomonas fulva]PYC14379.1 CPXCG motif-containing cysteine-rich protein [Pseudomonas fulva]